MLIKNFKTGVIFSVPGCVVIFYEREMNIYEVAKPEFKIKIKQKLQDK